MMAGFGLAVACTMGLHAPAQANEPVVAGGCWTDKGNLVVELSHFGQTWNPPLIVTFSDERLHLRRGLPDNRRTAQEEEPVSLLSAKAIENMWTLRVDDGWMVRRGERALRLNPPSVVRRPNDARILGGDEDLVWVGAPGVVVWIHWPAEGPPQTRVHRLATDSYMPNALWSKHATLLLIGRELYDCVHPLGCVQRGRLSGAIHHAVARPRGWLLAVQGWNPGLVRLARRQQVEPAILASGHVEALCPADGGQAWALLRQGAELRVVAASVTAPAVLSLPLEEALWVALLETPTPPASDVIVYLLRTAAEARWPQLSRLTLRFLRHSDAEVRIAVAGASLSLPQDRRAKAMQWFAQDQTSAVRAAAMDATLRLCRQGDTATCRAFLGLFLSDRDTNIQWQARDRLLEIDADAALRNASVDYKLDLLASLATQIVQDGRSHVLAALQRLMQDQNAKVRNQARVVWNRAMP